MKKGVLSMLLVMALALSLLPLGAAAEEGGDSGYRQMQLAGEDLTIYTKQDYPWTYGGNLFTSGNAGVMESFSSMKVVANREGLLTFDWSIDSFDGTAFFAYRTSGEYTNSAEVINQKQEIATGSRSGTESGIHLKEGETVYFTYYRIDLPLEDLGIDPAGIADQVTISNLRLEEYIQTDEGDFDKLVVYDEDMGTVTAQCMERKKDISGYEYTHLASVALDQVTAGATYRLKAVAKPGYRFYGWVQTYTYNGVRRNSYKGLKYYTLVENEKKDENGDVVRITNDKKTITVPELEAKLDGNSQYTAVFAREGAYIARVNARFYSADQDLAAILADAKSGDMVEILQNATLNADATVKKGVTLYVPFRAAFGDEDENGGKYRMCGGKKTVVQNAAYATLTIPEGTALTVKGTLAVGAVTSASGQGLQGHISGAYGEIQNNGKITVNEKGTMIAYGLVSGSGTVLAENYGIIKEPLIICDFAGGSNSLSLYTDMQIPFKRFNMQNIQCTLELERYGTLAGLITVYALGGFNEAEADVVGVTNNAIFRPNDSRSGGDGKNIILTRTYAPQYLDPSAGQSAGVGKTTWTLSGGLEFRSLTLDLGLATVATDHVDFPIPCHMDFVMTDGVYDIPGKLKILPGSHVTVAEDATLKIGDGSSFCKMIVMDGLKQKGMSGYAYPTREQLSVPGYGGSGTFTLNGTLHIASGSALGGVVQSDSDAGILIIEEGAYLKNSTADLSALDPEKAVDRDLTLLRQPVPETDTWVADNGLEGEDLKYYNWVQQDGGKGAYDDNTTWFNLPARVYNGTEMVELTPGTWKSSSGAYTFEDVSQQRWCTNAKTVSGAVAYTGDVRDMALYKDTFTRTVQGVWKESTSAVEVTSNTVAGGEKTGVTVQTIATRNDDGSTTLTLSTVDSTGNAVTVKYVHLVKYVTATGTETAQGTGDVYTIPAEAQSVTIESAMLGDTDLDGIISAADAAKIQRKVAGLDELSALQELTAGVDDDGIISAADAAKVKRVVAGLDSGL